MSQCQVPIRAVLLPRIPADTVQCHDGDSIGPHRIVRRERPTLAARDVLRGVKRKACHMGDAADTTSLYSAPMACAASSITVNVPHAKRHDRIEPAMGGPRSQPE